MAKRRWAITWLPLLLQLAVALPVLPAPVDDTYTKPDSSLSDRVFSRFFGDETFNKSYAVVIGIGDYDAVTKLDAPPRDALRMRDFLRDKAHFDYIVTLTDAAATQARIQKLMETTIPKLLNQNDRFLFYFSGHGLTRQTSTGPRGYLLLKPSHKENFDEMIGMPDISRWADNVGVGRHVLFLLDACSSGLAAVESKKVESESKTILSLSQPSSWMITAGVDEEESYATKGASLFTSAFLEIAGGEVNPPQDGIVDLNYIMSGIRRLLPLYLSRLGPRLKMTPHLSQFPRLHGNPGEFFFLVNNAEVAQPPPPPPPQQPPAPGAQPFQDCAACPVMVRIPAGHFTMGSPSSESGHFDTEGPTHDVQVPAFFLGKYDVTFDEFDACVGAGGCTKKPDDVGWGRGRRPVINVTWSDAQEYARWLSKKTGHTYRLPSEAEWEYAARARTTTPYYWGPEVGRGNANCVGCGSEWDNKQTAPVGSFDPNPWGLYDISGNVLQWTQDCWNDNYRSISYLGFRNAPADGRPWETGDCRRRVVRGGAWDDGPRGLRSAFRYWDYGVDYFSQFVGFRLARTQ